MSVISTSCSVKTNFEKLPAKVLLIDNFDSFSFNLVQYLSVLSKHKICVCRADKIENGHLYWATHIVLSPGPGKPSDATASIAVFNEWQAVKPILGVCLGMQVIVEQLGGVVTKQMPPVHGKADIVKHKSEGLFADIPSPLQVGRYHSLVCSEVSDCLEVIAANAENFPMAVQSVKGKIFGVQFHPESVLSESGEKLLHNFLKV